MKKNIQNFLFAGFLAISSFAIGQNSDHPNFISKIVPAIPTVISETATIRVSIIDGRVDNSSAISLVFENKTNQSLTFNWTLKDKSGYTFGETKTITVAANSTLDYSSKNEFSSSLIVIVSKNVNLSDYVIEIGN